MASVFITCGINRYPTQKAIGLRVGEVRRKYKEMLNIPSDAKALISGREVDEDYRLEPGDEVEFIKETGRSLAA